MPRKPRPFLVGDNWCTDAGGKRTVLARGRQNEKQALAALDALLERREEAARQGATDPDITVGRLVDLFLDDVQATRAAKTYHTTRYLLGLFRSGRVKLPARLVRKADVLQLRNRLLERHAANTVRGVVGVVGRLYAWASREAEIIADHNPARGVRKPAAEHRKRVMTPEEHARLLSSCGSDDDLADILRVLRLTSARPGELRRLEWAMIDWQHRLLVLHKHKTSTTAKRAAPRVIGFPPEVEEVLRRRQERAAGRAEVFWTRAGVPWTERYLEHAYRRACDRAGLGPDATGESLVPYSSRHAILTEAARAGATSSELKLLGGWTTLQMADTYVHLASQDVAAAAEKAAAAVLGRNKGKG
jgi:integrase